MDDLLADFVAETREMLEASQGEIIAWEADPSDRARLDAIFRFVHTVKGNCGFFDFPRLEKLSHAAEDALADVRADRRVPDATLVTAVLAIIDRISAMADAIEAGEEFPEGGDEELIAALEPGEDATGIVEGLATLAAGDEDSAPQKKASSVPSTARTIRLPTDLLDRVMSGVSDMVLARNDLAHRLRQAGTQPTIDGPFERLTTILTDVRDAITRMRMQRIEHLFAVFPRLVRDLSNELGKQVLIDLEGGDVELDREMVEIIRDPLTHIIRNALDHGIEPPSDRLKAGKRETGLLSIAARQSGNKISIVITDDGRGLNADKIGAKAVENGIVTEATLAQMDREAILQLVFEPGLSTAESVSSVSGRGVGLDVVRDNIERIGGSIKVTSTPEVGSLFYLSLPLTLSIISGVTVELGSQFFAIPQSYIEEIVTLDSEAHEQILMGDRGLVTFRGDRIPCLSLAEVLDLEHAVEPRERSAVMIRLASGDLIALIVDTVHNIGDLVVKPLPPVIMQSELFGGATQLEDGTPILVLDMPQIALNVGLISDTRNHARRLTDVEEDERSEGIYAMLYIGLDGRKQAMRMEMIQRIETVSVNAVDRSSTRDRVLVDSRVLPLVGLEVELPQTDTLRLLRLTDGENEIAYAIGRVLDATRLQEDLTPTRDDPATEGIAIVDGTTVPLVNGFHLFSVYGEVRDMGVAPTCTIPDSEWGRSILAPLVKACGYAVLSSDADAEADLVIKMADEEAGKSPAGTVITLHEDEQSGSRADNAIYRYDEEALVSALKQARSTLAKNTKPSADEEEAA